VLKRLEVDNYRTLVGFVFEPPESAVIVGENGAGKTALLSVLAGIRSIVVGGVSIEIPFPTSDVTRWSDEPLQTFALEVTDAKEHFRYELVLAHDRARELVAIQREQLRAGEDIVYEVNDEGVLLHSDMTPSAALLRIPFDRRRSFLPSLEPRPEYRRILAFRDLIADFWLFKLDPLAIHSMSKRAEEWLEEDGSNFAGWYSDFSQREEEKAAALRQELGEVLHGFVRFKNARTGGMVRELRAVFEASTGKDYEVSLDELSDGQRALAVLYAVLHAMPYGPALLVIDELENFVSLAELQPWLAKLDEHAEGKPWQRLILSHNPIVIDYLAADAALEMTRPHGGASQIAPLDIDLSEGLRASEVLVLGTSDDAESEAAPAR
jgi:predicted ATPase